jgi:uncharacterized membrane protein required for colicin V production
LGDNVVDAIRDAPLADLAIFAALFASFVVGVIQGSIRRVLGIMSMLLAFLLAANLQGPVGDFLAGNWRQFSVEYNRMLAFLLLFIVLAVGASIVIQGFYKRTDIYAAHPVVDDIVGGLLGLLQGFVVLTVLVIILNSHVPAEGAGEVSEIGSLQSALLEDSGIGGGIRDNVAPVVIRVFSPLLPGDLVAAYP